MGVSRRAKLTLIGFGLLAIFGYLVIVDLGVSAGRIHRGVKVAGIDVGGLTVLEAFNRLDPIGDELARSPLSFVPDEAGPPCTLTPEDLGWFPESDETADLAYEVGRQGFFASALWERVRAWTGAIDVGWADKPSPRKVTRFIDECEEQLEPFGIEIDRAKLRFRLKQAIGAYPYQQDHELPLAES
jgi:hypothetical protein